MDGKGHLRQRDQTHSLGNGRALNPEMLMTMVDRVGSSTAISEGNALSDRGRQHKMIVTGVSKGDSWREEIRGCKSLFLMGTPRVFDHDRIRRRRFIRTTH